MIVFGGLTQVLYVYVLSVSKSSHYSLAKDEVGRSAEVIISIPNEGIGTIAFDNVSGRVTLGARSTTGKQIVKGSVVRVEKIVGRVAYVRPLELGESEDRLLARDTLPRQKNSRLKNDLMRSGWSRVDVDRFRPKIVSNKLNNTHLSVVKEVNLVRLLRS